MRPIRTIDTRPDADEAEPDEAPAKRFWRWFELQTEGDTDGSKANKLPVLWCVHVGDVVKNATDIVSRLPLPDSLKEAVIFAARFHDHGKRRKLFQTVLGNFNPNRLLAKSGKRGGRVTELYRHEFGSLVDLEAEPEFQVIADDDQKELIRHLIAVHHGRGRPHFPADEAFDPEHGGTETIAAEVPRRFARLQRKYGRWGLAYLESLLRAADYAASAKPSAFVTEGES
jgi:CRISPR-associated endonuclease/helicase Cas3